MSGVVEFFDPTTGFGPWFGKMFLLFIASYLVIWLLAMLLCRMSQDAILGVYFGWLVPFTLHAILVTVLLLSTAIYYKQNNISPGYCSPYLLFLFVSSVCGLSLSGKINQRLNKFGQRPQP